jgi:small subunit ribosomal protein S3
MVIIKKYFINRGIAKMEIDEFFSREVKKAGYAGVSIRKTAIGTRITLYVERPGLVIGRHGTTIRELAQKLEAIFKIENPQIAVTPVTIPELNAKIMASRIASALERGVHFRRAAFAALNQIMRAGAKGAEITIRGKLTSERARYEKYRAGLLIKAGAPYKMFVDEAVTYVLLKPGLYGVKVKILQPTYSPEDLVFKSLEAITQVK